MKWLSCFLFFLCYFFVFYRSKIMVMDLFLVMFNVWLIVFFKEKCNEIFFFFYNEGIILFDSVFLLVVLIIDSWDSFSENFFRMLLYFFILFFGIFGEYMVGKMIKWVKVLVCSLRVSESDVGVLVLSFVFSKYVLDLGWMVSVLDVVVCLDFVNKLLNVDKEMCKLNYFVVEYLKFLIDWLNVFVIEGEMNFFEVCKNSFVYGVLFILRYFFEELDWNLDVVLFSMSEMSSLLEKFLEFVMRMIFLVFWVVLVDVWYFFEDMDDMVDDDVFVLDVLDEINVFMFFFELEDSKEKIMDNLSMLE